MVDKPRTVPYVVVSRFGKPRIGGWPKSHKIVKSRKNFNHRAIGRHPNGLEILAPSFEGLDFTQAEAEAVVKSVMANYAASR